MTQASQHNIKLIFCQDRPDYLGPDPFTVARKLNADRSLSDDSEEEEFYSSDDDDPDKVVAVPDMKTKPTPGDWLQHITKRELAKKQLKESIEKKEKDRTKWRSKFQVGVVWPVPAVE